MDSDVEPSAVFVGSSQIDSKQLQLPVAKPRSLSEQKDIDDFEKEERRIISEESSQVKKKAFKNYIVQIHVNFLIDLFFCFTFGQQIPHHCTRYKNFSCNLHHLGNK